MKPARHVVLSLAAALAVAAAAPLLHSQEGPLAAGSDGVPVPKRVKHVQPVYPPEAIAQGVRGIVILDLVIDTKGKVESVSVVRSVPGLDEAAIAAARQWEYEPVKMDGKPVSVRLTVPITFALALPRLVRDDGIPELRQGASPPWPSGAPTGGGSATAEVTLEPDGRIAVANVVAGGEPWSTALVNALRTWRFSPPPEDEELSFRVEAQWAPQRGNEQQRVALRASGLRRSDLLNAARKEPPTQTAAAEPPPQAPPSPPADDDDKPAAPPVQTPPAGAPAAPGSTPDARSPAPTSPAPTGPSAPGRPGPGTVAPPTAAPPTVPVAPPPETPPTGTGTPAPPTGAPPSPPVTRPPAGAPPPDAPRTGAASATAPPPVEVITAPTPTGPVENGVSAIRDVTLAPGVPDLARGRRPVPPPLARMSGTTGTVEVVFSVSAAGATTVQAARGPELLRRAAEQSVASWVFRRARADRAYLHAEFTYAEDKANVTVKPAAPPTNAATGEGVPATMAPAPQPTAPAVSEPAARTPSPSAPVPRPEPVPGQPRPEPQQPQQPEPQSPGTPPPADPATPPPPADGR
jgi:TonB family protein